MTQVNTRKKIVSGKYEVKVRVWGAVCFREEGVGVWFYRESGQ
jgi:hypothetical protein